MTYQTVCTENKGSKSASILALSGGRGSQIKTFFSEYFFEKFCIIFVPKTRFAFNFMPGSLHLKRVKNSNFSHDHQKAKVKCAK